MTGIELLLSLLCLNATCNTTLSTSSNNFLDESLEINSESATVKALQFSKLKDELSGQILRVVSLEDYPLSYTKIINGTRIGFGVSFKLLEFLTEKFNFSYELIVPEKNIVGSTNDKDGSLIAILENNKADIAAAFIPILSDARNHIFYSSTSLDEGEWIMMMLRPIKSASGSGLLAPFDNKVWILILVSLLAVGPIIYLIIIIRYKLTKDNQQQNYPLPHCVWFVYGALMKQGSTLAPIADSTRLLFATWWIFITILTSFYTANLTAFLTLSKFTLPINSPEDILKKDKHFVALRGRGGGIEYAIRNTDESLTMLSKLVDKKLGFFSESQNDTDILENYVHRKDYVFVRDRPAVDHLIYNDYRFRKTIKFDDEKIHCPFAVAKDAFLKRKRAFAYPKDSKWSTLFDPELLHLVEGGIVKYMLLEGLPKAKICPQTLGGTERQLKNNDFLTTYYVMFTGFCTGIVIFVTEMIFKYLNKRNFNKNHEVLDNKQAKNQPTFLANITPPPPYASLFNRNNKNNPFMMKDITYNEKDATRKQINGREYVVVKGKDDVPSRLIPVRVPSAALFQYTYSN